MKKLLAVVAIILAAVIFFFALRASIDDVDGLAGEPWVVVGMEDDGKEIPVEKILIKEMQFAKDTFTWSVLTRDGKLATIEGKIHIDPSKRPKQIDIQTKDEKEPVPGIYELKGDLLVICIGDRQRPTAFTSKEQTIWILKR